MSERSVFLGALDLDPTEWTAYLDRACGADASLRRGVEQLLKAHEQSGSFMEQPASPPVLTTKEQTRSDAPGTPIGRYKLLQQIGEGGFGVVHMAEQLEPVRRRVALKIIKPGMDTKEVIARFEAERQALALMDHPNIAKVLDGGTTEAQGLQPLGLGRPYFVMELVRGVPITDFCDQNHMPIRARLALFVHVCQAAQHAHQKGIIHRDLKPSNILVTLHDGTPVVKVIDFGIAKALGQQLTDKTLFTNFAQIIGTPSYMSPEQAEMSGLDIDTRSDVYSLGVLLYELLAGTTPFDKERLRTVSYDEMRRIIREEEPARPSTRLSTLGQAAATVAADRQSDPKHLSQLFRGELDWVVMRALEKNRRRRYESASAFAADVQRYLNDEPVQACPPSLGYRLRKFLQRNKIGVAVAGLVAFVVLLLLVLGVGVLVNNATREERDLARANEKRARDAEQRLVEAEREIKIRAHLARAVASRRSGTVGQRYRTLAEVADALKLNPPAELRQELRTEATAALALPDVEVAHEREGWPEESGGGYVAFDADFRRYARVDNQGGLTVCRLSEGREEVITRLPAHGKAPFGQPFLSPDGRFVASVHSRTPGDGWSGEVRVWNLDSPVPEVLLDEPAGIHEGAGAFHPSGRQLAIGHPDKRVSVYDLSTGRRVRQLAVSAPPIQLAFRPLPLLAPPEGQGNGRVDTLLAVAAGNAVQFFDTDTGRELPPLRHPAAVTSMTVAWHPDGRRLATGGSDRKIRVWDTETAAEVMPPWTGHTHQGVQVAFNHFGDRLASVDWSGQTRLWDAVNGRLLLTTPSPTGLQFGAGDNLLGCGRSGSRLQLWRLATGRELRVLRRRKAATLEDIQFPVVDRDGRILAAGGNYSLSFFDLASGEELASLRQPWAQAFNPMLFHPSGGWVTGGTSVLLWPARPDPARPEVLRVGPPQPLSAGLRSASATVDGRILAGSQGNSVVVLHRDPPERRVVLGPQFDVRFTAVSPDGRLVVTGSHWPDQRSSSARIWDAENGQLLHELPLHDSTTPRFSPDGRWLMTATAGVGCHLWEVGSWREVRRYDHAACVFSPDSRLLAISDVFSVVRLIETATGREVARLTGPEPNWYLPACFTPDGSRLVTTLADTRALYVWDLRLIRQQLKELGLDWDWEEFPPPRQAGPGPPLQVTVDGGDFVKQP